MDNNLFDWMNDNQDNENNTNNTNEEFLEEDQRGHLNDKEYSSQENTSREDVRAENFADQETKETSSTNDQTVDDYLRDFIKTEVKKNTKPKRRFAKGLALVIAGSLIGSGLGYTAARMGEGQVNISNQSSAHQISIQPTEDVSAEKAVALKATPSVVGIQVDVTTRGGFFGNQMMQGQAIGSGVIVSEDGYILTNAHVIQDAKDDNTSVLFHDNEKAQAVVVWKDENLDLAIVKTNMQGLTPVELGDSDQISVGDKAIAIGNPVGLNLQSTLTSGYISGTNRSIQMQTGQVMDGLFQTDAAINSGNSGGALLNSQGQLIGINTAKVQSTDGIGFAIPVNVAKPIIKSVIDHGSFTPIQLGIQGVDLDIYKQYYSKENNFGTDSGVVVMDIVAGGNASNSELRVGDVIVAIDGNSTESMNQLKQRLLTYSVSDKAELKVYRDGKETTVNITFQAKKSNL